MNKEQTIEFLTKAANEHASDIFIIAGRPLAIKIDGHLSSYGDRLMPDQTEEILRCIYQMAHRDIDHLLSSGDDDFLFLHSRTFQISYQRLQTARFSGSRYPGDRLPAAGPC